MLKQAMSNELRHEGSQTKKLLERTPYEQFDWKPHERSMQLGRLAVHIAEIPKWASRILTSNEFDFTKADYKATPVNSTIELVQLSEDSLKQAVEDFNSVSEEDLMTSWTFRRGEHIIFTLPRA